MNIKVHNQCASNDKKGNRKPEDIVLMCEVHCKKIIGHIIISPFESFDLIRTSMNS
jgi:hypothetical protein